MIRLIRRLIPFAMPLAFAFTFADCAPARAPVSATAKHYACAPCNGSCDLTTYDHPGTCPVCGMPLVEVGSTEHEAPRGKPLAILLFDGVEIIDFTAPWEVFGAAGFDVYTVAATREPVTTSMGMKVVPRYTFADAPAPAVLLVPGGSVHAPRHSEPTLRWVRDASAHSEVTLSVCNGAFILAGAGLLDGLTATTTARLIGDLGKEFPKTHVVSDRRFVDNGKIVTAAGLSAGIDGALHVVEKLGGRGDAEKVALGLEYDWHAEGGFVRAALADQRIPPVDLDAIGTWGVDKTEGTTERWEMVVHGTSVKSAAEIHRYFAEAFTRGGWRTSSQSELSSEWRVAGTEGEPWSGKLAVRGDEAHVGTWVVTVGVARAK